jgi:hypothetical protein
VGLKWNLSIESRGILVNIVYSTRVSVPWSELGPTTTSPASECGSPQDLSEGETHSLAGEEVREPNSDERTDTLVLYAYYNPSTLQSIND